MGRPRTPIGTFGEISFVKVAGGQVQARTRFRDDDGQVRRVSATGVSRKEAERNLKKVLAQRASHVASGEITADTSFAKLVAAWLADIDLENKLAPSTRALYERNMRQLVMPAFEHYLLREITVRQVDQFIKTLAATKSYSMAKQARTVLSLAFGLAVHVGAHRRGAGHPQVRYRCDRVSREGAPLWNDRHSCRQAHPPTASPEDRPVHTHGLGPELHRGGTS